MLIGIKISWVLPVSQSAEVECAQNLNNKHSDSNGTLSFNHGQEMPCGRAAGPHSHGGPNGPGPRLGPGKAVYSLSPGPGPGPNLPGDGAP